jgi:peptidoglycan/LPS O-acetylase OafA/YrhL
MEIALRRSTTQPSPIGTGAVSRRNNFNLIRLAAALQVALLHASEHLRVPLGSIGPLIELFPGVPVFFFISGLMVTASAYSRPLGDYAAHRFRRIFPALWVAFALTLLVLVAFSQIGPIESVEPIFWWWVAAQLTLFQAFNPEMFADFGVGVVNGSLWTIPVEIGFYVMLPALIWLSGGSRKTMTALLVVGAALTFSVGQVVSGSPTLSAKVISATPLAHFWLFALGSLAYLHMGRIKPLLAQWPLMLIAYLGFSLLCAPLLPDMLGAGLEAVLLCAVILGLGLGAPNVSALLRGNDLSYGLYLYHMLVVNSLAALGFTGALPMAWALVASLGLALLSWHYVERPRGTQRLRAA